MPSGTAPPLPAATYPSIRASSSSARSSSRTYPLRSGAGRDAPPDPQRSAGDGPQARGWCSPVGRMGSMVPRTVPRSPPVVQRSPCSQAAWAGHTPPGIPNSLAGSAETVCCCRSCRRVPRRRSGGSCSAASSSPRSLAPSSSRRPDTVPGPFTPPPAHPSWAVLSVRSPVRSRAHRPLAVTGCCAGCVTVRTMPSGSGRGSSPTRSMLSRQRKGGIVGVRCCEAGGAPGVKATGWCR